MPTVVYQCADGTPFPVEFATEEDAALEWGVEQEHSFGPSTPLAHALGQLGRPGAERAYGEAGLPFPSMWREGPEANGFTYFVAAPMPPEEMGAMFSAFGPLMQEYGSALGIWRDHSLPNIRTALQRIDGAGPEVPLGKLAEEQAYAMHHTMVSSMVSGNDMQLMEAVCRDAHGDQAALVAYELSQGYENDTVGIGQALWELGRVASVSPDVMAALESADPVDAMASLRSTKGDRDFFAALETFLAEFGGRAETWSISSPTWAEQGEGFWAQLRQMSGDDVPAPGETVARAAVRRTELARDTEQRLPDDEAIRSRFRRRVERLSGYVAVREERAHWQLIGVGCLRHAVLRRGAVLVERGVIDTPDDVLFLLPAEIEDDAAADRRALVGERRDEHERWSARRPPQTIGGDAPAAPEAAAEDGVIRGVAGSRGTATGTARVILDLADADRLASGDVLVCVMTAPPWTPLFALASAVVVDTGGLGAHAAIAAREYGIPCVLRTREATVAIPDGAMVTVDGTEGTVTIAR